jgi:hypothetical protein
MGIKTSTRHQKIIGDYGENLICNWLSRSGFEVAIIDYTGIDIVAYNPITDRRLVGQLVSRLPFRLLLIMMPLLKVL